MHMFVRNVVNTMAKANLDLSHDVQIFIGLICILPLIECIQSKFSKFAQACNVFIYNFDDVIKPFKGGM
jgi:hypothetical protein